MHCCTIMNYEQHNFRGKYNISCFLEKSTLCVSSVALCSAPQRGGLWGEAVYSSSLNVWT